MTILLAVAAAAAIGCGGDDDSGDSDAPTGSDGEAEIQALFDDYYGGDVEAHCATFTTETLDLVGGESDCVGNEAQVTKTKFEISSVKFTDAGVTVLTSAGPDATETQFLLVAEDGAWRIENPPPILVD